MASHRLILDVAGGARTCWCRGKSARGFTALCQIAFVQRNLAVTHCTRAALIYNASEAVVSQGNSTGHTPPLSARTMSHSNGTISNSISNAYLSEQCSAQRIWLIVLNHTLPEITADLWRRSHYKICADGGANRIFDELPALVDNNMRSEVRTEYVPDAIAGDLDSMRPDVQKFYASLGVPAKDLSADQDSTDLEKCLQLLKKEMRAVGAAADGADDVIVILGAIGGRFDHTLANLNVLYCNPDDHLVLMGDGNLVRLLPRGASEVRMNAEAESIQCGVVPLNGPSRVTSSGLRWDMEDLELKFCGLLSTSNQVASDVVTVQCSEPCLWISVLKGFE